MTGWTTYYSCSFFIEFEFSYDIRFFAACKAGRYQLYIFLICKCCIFNSTISPICDNCDCFFLGIHLLQVFFQKLTITMEVLLICIISYYRAIFTDGFISLIMSAPTITLTGVFGLEAWPLYNTANLFSSIAGKSSSAKSFAHNFSRAFCSLAVRLKNYLRLISVDMRFL